MANQSEVQAAVPQSPIQDYKQNGSWVVDHFSAEGAQLIIDFWPESLLFDNTPDLIRQVGNYMWEDSQKYKFGVTTYWTPNLPHTFATNRGYSINKYIPVVTDVRGSTTSSYILDDGDEGVGFIEDYQQTVSPHWFYITIISLTLTANRIEPNISLGFDPVE